MLAACAAPELDVEPLAAPVAALAVVQRAPACNPRANVLKVLARRFGEALVATGLTSKGSMIEVLRASDGGTWTIIVTFPNGVSCLVASGKGWRDLPREEPEEGT